MLKGSFLATVLGMALVLAGCAGGSGESASADATQAGGAKSSGLLGRLVDRSRPVIVPEGTAIPVTLDQSLASNRYRSGDGFEATLAGPITVDGKVVVPRGVRVRGRVVEARESGRLKGVAMLRLALEAIEVGGIWYDVQSSSLTRTGGDHKTRNLALIGGGAGLGTAVGAIAGGGKGALIGGAVGAGAGTATAAATGKKDIVIPAETALTFKLTQAVAIQVRG
jgi:outer membrane lipoprotein SlyB